MHLIWRSRQATSPLLLWLPAGSRRQRHVRCVPFMPCRWSYTPDELSQIPSAVDGCVVAYNSLPGSNLRYYNTASFCLQCQCTCCTYLFTMLTRCAPADQCCLLDRNWHCAVFVHEHLMDSWDRVLARAILQSHLAPVSCPSSPLRHVGCHPTLRGPCCCL